MPSKYLLLSLSTLFCTSCATTNRIFPMEGDRYKIIVHSPTESNAYDRALNDIQGYCANKGVDYEVIEDIAEYRGIEKGTKAFIGTSDALSRDMVDIPHSSSLDKSDDNRVTITFRCKSRA